MKKIYNYINKKLILILLAMTCGVLYLKVFIPVTGIHIPCIFRQITGFYCPGCGMTRASLAFLNGDIYQSFRNNILIFIIVPLFIIFYLLEKNGKLKESRLLMGFMVSITILFGVLRNFEAFNWLAPI